MRLKENKESDKTECLDSTNKDKASFKKISFQLKEVTVSAITGNLLPLPVMTDEKESLIFQDKEGKHSEDKNEETISISYAVNWNTFYSVPLILANLTALESN